MEPFFCHLTGSSGDMSQESPESPSPDEPPPYGRPYGSSPPPSGWAPPQGSAWSPPPHGHGPGPAGSPPYVPAPAVPTLAEFWQRIVARLLDGVVVSVILSPLLIWYFQWYFGHVPDMMPADPNDPA